MMNEGEFYGYKIKSSTAHPMTPEQDKYGFGSIFSVSCRTKAEEFARCLQSRLRTLGSRGLDANDWISSNENSLSFTQEGNSKTELYYDLTAINSSSPPEIDETGLNGAVINYDRLQQYSPSTDFRKEKLELQNCSSYDSADSSDSSYFDSELCTCVLPHYSEHYCQERQLLRQANDREKVETEKFSLENLINKSFSTSNHLKHFDDFADSSEVNMVVNDLQECEHNEEDNMKNDMTETKSQCKKEIKTDQVNKDKNNGSFDYIQNVRIEINVEIEENSCMNRNGDVIIKDSKKERIPRLRRSSSLKSGKTPPDTPGKKKIVKFADAMGLDLESVKTFLNDIPKVPNSAYRDLQNVDFTDDNSNFCFHFLKPLSLTDTILVPLFNQPGEQPDFANKVRDSAVCLENARVSDPVTVAISGIVRVKNLDFHKSVHVRYSLDGWKSFADCQANYVLNSCDGFSDQFSFLLYANTLAIGQNLEMAIRFQCKGSQYWDNNGGVNYCFECLPKTDNQHRNNQRQDT